MNEYFIYGGSVFARDRKGRAFIIDVDDIELLAKHRFTKRPDGYMGTKRCEDNELLHRFVIGAKRGMEVDHISGHRWDNRKSNLRFVTRAQNMANSRTITTSKTGIKGVTFRAEKQTKPWRARIRVNHKPINLGEFDTVEEAMAAYNAAAIKFFGEYARLHELDALEAKIRSHSV